MTDISHQRVPTFLCPHCGYAMNAGTDVIDPNHIEFGPGDIGICLSCGAVFQLQEDGSRHWLTAPEIAALDADTRRIVARFESLRHRNIPPGALVTNKTKQ